MPKHLLCKQRQLALLSFIEGTNISILSTSLRTILLDYIALNKDLLPVDFDIQLKEWNLLFELLDALQ
ncbi:MAG: hypothetical protein JST29_01505 [Bacteroidetes bacterium]|nr:hypothetical protein [Bacteroidota bacterium]